jgi:hypothetical protein
MKRFIPLFFFSLALLTAQSTDDDDLTPEEKYLKTMLNPQGSGAGISMEYSVSGSAELDYGSAFDDGEDDYTQGFLTTIDSSLDITFTFNPDEFSASSGQSYLKKGIYAEIVLSDFEVEISNDAGIDFWDSYTIYDSDGNAYLPDQESDSNTVLDEADTEDEVTYEETILYTGISVTAPTVEANIHLNSNMYFQLSSQPELDYNMSTTLGGQGEWAGADTENSGGFSFILDYPHFDMEASIVSEYYYTEDDITQDDEFGGGISLSYELNNSMSLEGYGAMINFYDYDNDDDYYMLTDRYGSSVDCLLLTGASATYSYFELVDFGLYGDFGYAYGGSFNVGETSIYEDDDDDDDDELDEEDGAIFMDYEGFLFDVRLDLPFPFARNKGLITFSCDTYGYSFAEEIFEDYGIDDDYLPIDLQLAFSYTEERWQIEGALQAFNILDFENSVANYVFDDHQELGGTFTGQYTFGNASHIAFTPSVTVDYSTGMLMTEGWYWDETDGSDDDDY